MVPQKEGFQLIVISKRQTLKLKLGDFVYSVGELFNVNIDKPLLKGASSAYSKHKIHLQELKKTTEEDHLGRKCKSLNDELVSLKHKKQCFESDSTYLEKDADKCAERAKKNKVSR